MQKQAVVYFPSLNLEDITTLRQKYDPNWNIINPHITLVFPLSEIPEELLLQHVERVTKEVKSFSINLCGVTKTFDDYLFLLVKEGSQAIIMLRNKLYTGILAAYLQTNVPFTPHITLGYLGKENDGLNNELYKNAYEETKRMKINLKCNFDNITLIKGDGITSAKIIKTFNLN